MEEPTTQWKLWNFVEGWAYILWEYYKIIKLSSFLPKIVSQNDRLKYTMGHNISLELTLILIILAELKKTAQLRKKMYNLHTYNFNVFLMCCNCELRWFLFKLSTSFISTLFRLETYQGKKSTENMQLLQKGYWHSSPCLLLYISPWMMSLQQISILCVKSFEKFIFIWTELAFNFTIHIILMKLAHYR